MLGQQRRNKSKNYNQEAVDIIDILIHRLLEAFDCYQIDACI